MARRARKNQEVTLGRQAAQKKRTEKKERERSDRYNTVSCYFMYDSIFYTSLCRTEDSCTRRFYGYDSL